MRVLWIVTIKKEMLQRRNNMARSLGKQLFKKGLTFICIVESRDLKF